MQTISRKIREKFAKNGAKVHQFLMNKFINSSKFNDELPFISNLGYQTPSRTQLAGQLAAQLAAEQHRPSEAASHEDDLQHLQLAVQLAAQLIGRGRARHEREAGRPLQLLALQVRSSKYTLCRPRSSSSRCSAESAK